MKLPGLTPLKKKESFIFLFGAIFLICPPLILWGQESGPRLLDEKLQLDLADHFYSEGDYYRAITEYKRFLFFFPKSLQVEEVYGKIARSYLKGQKWEEALDTLERWHSKFPNSLRRGEIYLLKGLGHLGKKEYSQARYFFNQAQIASPGTEVEEEAHFQAARTYMEEEKWKEAALEFRKIAPHSPLFIQGEYFARGLDKINQVPQKSPVAAGLLAALLPGAGHLYGERYRDAAIAFLLNAVFIWGIVEAWQNESYVVGGILTFFELGWYSGNIYSAISSAHKYNRQKKKEYLNTLEKMSPLRGGIFFHGQTSLLVVNFAF